MSILSMRSTAGVERLREFAARRNAVLLAGSGVSIWNPTNVPAGQPVAKALAKMLVPQADPSVGRLVSFVERNAFEHIFEKCPRHEAAREWIESEFMGEGPNPIHIAIAELVSLGAIEHIITTNYDLSFEEALVAAGVAFHRVVSKKDGLGNGQPILFKLHGSADEPASLVFALRHESEMSSWKRNLLFQLLKSRDLLVCGYSGMDFEVCPELAAASPASVIWNSFSDPAQEHSITPNARRVISAHCSDIIWGDMRTCLSILLNKQVEAKPCQSEISTIITRLFNRLSPDERHLWQAALMNGIGAGRAAAEALRRLTKENTAIATKAAEEHARALFHIGKYRSSALAFESAAREQERMGCNKNALHLRLSAAESYRCYGSWAKAWKIADQVETGTVGDQVLTGAVERLRVLLLRHRKDFADLTLRPQAARRAQRLAIPKLKVAFEAAKASGNWHDMQMCIMWCERMEITVNEIAKGSFVPLASSDGWTQIGYIIAEWMALRDEAARHYADPSVQRRLEEALADALDIGSMPEAWKIAMALRFTTGKRASGLTLNGIRSFFACEYSPIFRLFSVARTIYANKAAKQGILPGF